jgi:hypothetical protein
MHSCTDAGTHHFIDALYVDYDTAVLSNPQQPNGSVCLLNPRWPAEFASEARRTEKRFSAPRVVYRLVLAGPYWRFAARATIAARADAVSRPQDAGVSNTGI